MKSAASLPPVASLPMYDWPEAASATDALWRAIATRLDAAGIAAPQQLDRSRDPEAVWRDPALVLSQTCGFPYATRLRDAVRLVATPVYSVEGCEKPLYSSFFVARREERGGTLADFAGRRFAFNARDSLSGHVAPVAAMREAGMSPGDVAWIETGGHRESIRAVAEGRADLAAIDAVCWDMAQRFESEATARLHPIARTPLWPALPFITAGGRSDAELEAIRVALVEALASDGAGDACKALRIEGVAFLAAADYEPLADLIP